jgi:hypothetical protein
MMPRMIPYLLIIIPIIGFFFTPDPPSANSDGRQTLGALPHILLTIPWWWKILSIFIGVTWIVRNRKNDETNEQ